MLTLSRYQLCGAGGKRGACGGDVSDIQSFMSAIKVGPSSMWQLYGKTSTHYHMLAYFDTMLFLELS